MIAIHRSRRRAPSILRSPVVDAIRSRVRKFFARPEALRRQQRPDFPKFPTSKFKDVMDSLSVVFHGKCAYCDSPVELPRDGLDRFRPKWGAVGLDHEYAPDHYWWLAYEWENLYLACATCNQSKGPKFPVEGTRVPLEATLAKLGKEKRLLIDPCADEPSAHLAFSYQGTVQPRSRMGEVTIAVLELNRASLVNARIGVARKTVRLLNQVPTDAWIAKHRLFREQDLLLYLEETASRAHRKQKSAGAAIGQLESMVSDKQPYAAVARDLLWERVASATQRKEVAGLPTQRRTRTSGRIRDACATHEVLGAEIRNYRGIQDLSLSRTGEQLTTSSWLMFLGENGSGKSTILQAIALALVRNATAKLKVTPASVLRQGSAAGFVRVQLSGVEEPIELSFSRGSPRFERTGFVPRLVVLGYGATRLLPRGFRNRGGVSIRDRRHKRVENLFDPFRPMINADRWLGTLKKRAFDYVARAIKDVLGLPRTSTLRRVRRARGPGVQLKLHGASLNLDQLSEGYQSVLGLTCDLIAGLHAGQEGGLEAAEGIALLDELGAHLHPRWRMRIVGRLRKAFPRLQLLASTHDPLCLRGLRNGEVTVLRRSNRGKVFIVSDLPPIEGLTSEGILTSEYFGLSSTLDPDLEQKFNELYRLLPLRKPKLAQKVRIVQLRKEIAPFDLPGVTRRERRLLQIIDLDLATEDLEPDPKRRAKVKRETQAQIAADLGKLIGESK